MRSYVYRKIQTTYHFTDVEMQKLSYTFYVFVYEISKFLILGIAFSLLGLWHEYVISLLALMPVRVFSGGIHFNHYYSCFLFTASFFVVAVLMNAVSLPYPAQPAVMLLCAGVTYFIGPVTSKKRPPIQFGRYQAFRLVSTGLLLLWFLWFVFVRKFPYQNICFWILFLQTIQLICAKLARKGDIYEKN